MRLIFAKSLIDKEKLNPEDKKILIKYFARGIFKVIKGNLLPKDSNLIKIYLTNISGARRAVFLVSEKSAKGFFLMYRSKNDKIGSNISIKNKLFDITLKEYLSILKADIDCASLEIYDIN